MFCERGLRDAWSYKPGGLAKHCRLKPPGFDRSASQLAISSIVS